MLVRVFVITLAILGVSPATNAAGAGHSEPGVPAAAKARTPPLDFSLLTGSAGKSWRYVGLTINGKAYDIAKHAGKRHIYYPDGRLVMVIPGADTKANGHWEKTGDKSIHVSDGEFVSADYLFHLLTASRIEYEYTYQGFQVFEALVPADDGVPAATSPAPPKADAPTVVPRADDYTAQLFREDGWTSDAWIRDRYASGKDQAKAGIGKDEKGRDKSVEQMLSELERISAAFVTEVKAAIAGDYWGRMPRVNTIYNDGERYIDFLNGKSLTPEQRRRKEEAGNRMLQGMLSASRQH